MSAQKSCRRFVWLAVAVLVLGLPPAAAAEESPEVIENETGFYYTIRKGDTLWDLSERFSDSPWQWPALWEENDQIANPHWIYPGERIRLFRKQDLEKVFKKEETPALEAPAPGVEEVLPEEDRPYMMFPRISSVGFVRKEPLVSSGVIFKVRDDHELISTGDIVYIEPNPKAPTMSIGERYTLYRNRRWIGQVRKNLEKYGVQYFLTGVVEIFDKEGDIAIGRIVETYRAIHLKDKLIPYEPRSPKITISDTPEGPAGRVFLAEEHQELIGAGHIVFIDQGANDGIRRGQIYKIYYQESDQRDPSTAKVRTLASIPFAELIVLHTESTTATCLVINSRRQIETGARVGNFVK